VSDERDTPTILAEPPPRIRRPRFRLSPLVTIYLAKREALVGFFTARLGSAAAAEDLVQDIYLKVCTLDASVEVQNEAAFLYRLGTNLMLDRLRQQRRSAVRDGHWRASNTTLVEGEEIADEPGADEAVAGRERLALMLAALEELPAQQRQAFRLHKLESRSQAETAEALGCSVSSVEKYIRAALKHLVARLG
jgi:RNA polymerase sigma-70 factor (ECF subfamily)